MVSVPAQIGAADGDFIANLRRIRRDSGNRGFPIFPSGDIAYGFTVVVPILIFPMACFGALVDSAVFAGNPFQVSPLPVDFVLVAKVLFFGGGG